jgi:hypothetical protein
MRRFTIDFTTLAEGARTGTNVTRIEVGEFHDGKILFGIFEKQPFFKGLNSSGARGFFSKARALESRAAKRP